MLEIKGISKKFGKLKVLDNIHLNFSEPGIYAILGPNGSGKTTLIKSILGMVIPDEGQMLLNNEIINNQYEYRRDISYLPQVANFPDNLTGNELISMVKDIREQEGSLDELIRIFGLKPYLDKNLKYLSGGTKQKINVTLALMFDSPIMIFDEPTAGLDPIALIRFKELIIKMKEAGKIIILTTHIIGLVEEIADKIIFLLDGKIHFIGTTQELLSNVNSKSLIKNIVSLEQAIAQILERNYNDKDIKI